MNQHAKSTPRSAGRTALPRQKAKIRALRVLSEILRGTVFGGAAFCLSACSLWFGAAPFGIALLSAASSYTWYILTGLLVAAFVAHPASPLSGWAWLGIYLLCVILRLVIRFFVDPPAFPDGRPCTGRAYFLLCWVSFKRNVGLIADEESPAGDTADDYYEGVSGGSARAAQKTDAADASRRDKLNPHLFAEHPFLRMLTAAVCGFMAGLFHLIHSGFHLYDLFGALLTLVLAPAATFLLVSCFGEAGMTLLFSRTPLGNTRSGHEGAEIISRFHALPLLSVCFLLGAAVYGARGLSFTLGTPYVVFSTATLLGLMLTLFASLRLGVIPGIAVSVVCGIAASPAMSPIFILCAGGFALLRRASLRAGVIGGCAIGGIYCIAMGSVDTVLLHLPATILTIPVFFLTERLWETLPHKRARRAGEGDLEHLNAMVSSALAVESHADSQRTRLKALSDAFGALSQRFYDLSSQLRRPRMLDLRRLCDESFGKQCARCRNRDACWGAEYDRTLEVQARLCSQLHTGGRADASSLPDSLRDFCPHMEEMVSDINARCARMTEALLKSEKTEVFAADYAAIATLLSDALEEDRLSAEDYKCNREAADGIYDYLTSIGVTAQGVVVCGKRGSGRQKVIVRGTGFDHSAKGVDSLCKRIGEICGVALTEPQFEADEEGLDSEVMTLHTKARMDTVYAGSTVPADAAPDDPLPPPLTDSMARESYAPPAVCGDHIAMFKTEDAYFYAIISDGMGSGEDASLTSDICTMFLEKMLSAGNKVEISLRMLDSYVRSKNQGTGDECSATVDLMELDLMDGQAVFAKNGAAPTYVVRDGTVYKLRTSSMPLGIIKDNPYRLLRFRMHPGDVVVMVSDGVTLGNDECPWLIDLLSSPMPENMDSLRRDIIRRALTAGSEDDLSAVAIRVEER